jgi:hypothetical protein
MRKENYILLSKHLKSLRDSQLKLGEFPCRTRKEAELRNKMQRDYFRIKDILECAAAVEHHPFVDPTHHFRAGY